MINLENYTFLHYTGMPAVLCILAVAAAVVLAFWILSRICKGVVMPRLIRFTEKHEFRALRVLAAAFARVVPAVIWITGLCAAVSILPWTPAVEKPLDAGVDLFYRIFVVLAVSRALWHTEKLCSLALNSATHKLDMAHNQTLSNILEKAYRVVVVAFAAIAVMDILGYPVTGLITGFGLVGLTVSLAAQDSASNLFSGMMILLEHPFGIGDWIKVGDVEGTVEDLTFRSTKVRALDNSLYVLPNSSVTSATVNNGTNRTKRMFRFTLGVTYDTTRPQIERLMADLEALLKSRSDVQQDSVVVRLTGFGDSSIDILVSAYIMEPDLGRFLAVQNSLNLDIMDVMNKNGVDFAFPSTSVYIEKSAK